MCLVSAVSGHFKDQYPLPNQFPSFQYPGYLELVDKARKFDELTNQKDCQDEDKAKWEEDLKKFMKETYGLDPIVQFKKQL